MTRRARQLLGSILGLILIHGARSIHAEGRAFPYVLDGSVVGVTDGDTIKVLRGKELLRVRLDGIDAPEKKQAYGQRAKEKLSSLVFGKEVQLVVKSVDRYGRLVAEVRAGGRSANAEMVAAGLAWHYKAYSKDQSLAALERSARERRLGLWADKDPVPPWEFRRARRR